MPLLARLSSLWNNLLHHDRVEREIDEEVRGYVEALAHERVRAGSSREEALRQARLEAGGIEQVKEEVRDARLGVALETAAKDLRYGIRGLLRSPGFSAAALLALALGIGASSAIFSVVEAVLLRPLPYRNPQRVVVVMHDRSNPVAPANFLDWRRQATSFERMGAADYWTPNLNEGDTPESILAVRVTADVPLLLGVPPRLGRLFLPEEEQPGRDHSVILSDRLFRRRFAGDPRVLGRSLTLNGEPYTIVGVMPPGFEFPPFWARGAQLWAPLALGDRVVNRGGQSLRLFARLKPGATLSRARSEVAAITARLERLYPGSNRGVTVTPLEEMVVSGVRPALLVLLGAVSFVLLIACANVAHMLLARATVRRKEIAVRCALGASRARVVRHFLAESLVLGLAGGAMGLALALGGIRVLLALAPTSVPGIEAIRLNASVVLFTIFVSLLTGLVFGLGPALHASRSDPSRALCESERGSTEGAGARRLRGALVGSEFALALILLVGAGLMIRSFAALRRIDPGWDPRHVLTMVVSVAGSPEAASGTRSSFYQEALQEIRALPGVEEASAINHLPIAGDIWGWSFTIAGRPVPPPGDSPGGIYRVVLPGYFRTMGIPILRGHDIDERDRLDGPGSVVVNQSLADRYFPGQDPLGQRVTFDDQTKNPQWLTIVGVVKNVVRSEWAAPPSPELYMAYLQNRSYLEKTTFNYTYMTLVIRTGGDPSRLASSARQAIWSLDRGVTISDVQTMEKVVADATAEPRFYLFLLATFAAVAVILAAVGIYGVMSYAVSRRTHEIGLRMALGARPEEVTRLVVRQGLWVAVSGAAFGLAGALLLTRLMASLLYGVGSTDPATYAAVWLLLTAVALAASYVPARRATRIDPMIALRHD